MKKREKKLRKAFILIMLGVMQGVLSVFSQTGLETGTCFAIDEDKKVIC